MHISGIFTACCYAESPQKNNNVRNDVIIVTENSDHDRVVSMSCLQKVAHNIEYLHEKMYENVYVWSDGMGHNLDLAIYSNY